MKKIRLALSVVGCIFLTIPGCGVAGPPLPPEEIGIEAKLREQERAKQPEPSTGEKAIVPIEEEAVVLPPLQSVGSQ